MKAVKLKSGNWNARVYLGDENGKPVYRSITRPTKAECLQDAYLEKAKYKSEYNPQNKTVKKAVEEYISLSKPVLSPTTIAGYEKMLSYAFPDLMDKRISDLNSDVIQEAVNAETKRGRVEIRYINSDEGLIRRETEINKPISAKTIENEWRMIASALKRYNLIFSPKLPRKVEKLKEYPDPKPVMDAIRGSSIELPCLLAMWLSFTLSEVRGLTFDSVRNGYIHIDKVKVMAGSYEVVKEAGKATKRNRKLKIPAYIERLINISLSERKSLHGANFDPKSEYIVTLSANALSKRFKVLMQKNGLDLTFHQLRHMNASIMESLNVPSKYQQERGGWSTDSIMKNVYQHTLSGKRQEVDRSIDQYFNDLIETSIKS